MLALALALAAAHAAPDHDVVCPAAHEAGIRSGPPGWGFWPSETGRLPPVVPWTVTRLVREALTRLEAQGTTVVAVALPPRTLLFAPGEVDVPGGVAWFAEVKASYDTYRAQLPPSVVAPDVAFALRPYAHEAFQPLDFHVTTTGAQHLAEHLAAVIRDQPAFERLPRGTFKTVPGDTTELTPASTWRAEHCGDPVGTVSVDLTTTVRTDGASLLADLPPAEVVVVGDSQMGPAYNVPGRLSEALGTQVDVAPVPGGGAVVPLLSWLGDPERRAPAVLVWQVSWRLIAGPGNADRPSYSDPIAWRRVLGRLTTCEPPSPPQRLRRGRATTLQVPRATAATDARWAVRLDVGDAGASPFDVVLTRRDGLSETVRIEPWSRLRDHDRVWLSLPWGEGAALDHVDVVFAPGTRGEVAAALCATPTP